MFITKRYKLFIAIAVAGMLLSVIAVFAPGLKLGTDFTGGSIIEISYPDGRPDMSEVDEALSKVLDSYTITESGTDAYQIRTAVFSQEVRNQLTDELITNEGAVLERFSSIGPAVGDELRQKSVYAISFVVVAIILFVATAFRHVAKPVSSWYYGLAAIAALLHDILIPTGIFAVLGVVMGAEVDTLFVTALLAILGFSVNDTIVVFDRVRENLKRNNDENIKQDFEDVVGRSIDETFSRSINTSLTSIAVLVMLYVLGTSTIRPFVLTLMIGITAGTYSSLFFASPILIAISKKLQK